MSNPHPTLAMRLLAAYTEGEAKAYLNAYTEVLEQLEAQRATGLLVSVVNTVLKQMKAKDQTAYVAGKELMGTLDSQRGKMFVMAAMVDIALNERKAGEVIGAVGRMKETLERA